MLDEPKPPVSGDTAVDDDIESVDYIAVAAAEEEEPELSAPPSLLVQIPLILLAGVYLSVMIWLYIRIPAMALLFVAVGAGIFLHGYVQHLRKPHP